MTRPLPPTPTWNEARSIHVGLNRVDERVYQGWLPPLLSAELDALAMRDVADGMGCAARLLLGEEATRDGVRAALESTIERLVAGDFLLISYSGHMTSLRGAGDDPDGWDEAWCLHDGVLLDDEFHDLLAEVPPDVDVLVVTDACFGEGITDLRADDAGPRRIPAPAGGGAPAIGSSFEPISLSSLPAGRQPFADVLRRATTEGRVLAKAPATRAGDLAIGRLVRQGAIPSGARRRAGRRPPIRARVVALAAADEASLAYEGDKQGLFTAALLEVIERGGSAPASYSSFMDEVAGLLRLQRPTLGVLGADASAAARRTPFAADFAAPEPYAPRPSRFQ